MKNLLKLVVLAGVLSLSWDSLENPVYAAGVACAVKDGTACTQTGPAGNCWYFGEECYLVYPCWCDRAFGPLQIRCGPNPTAGTC